MKSKAQEQFALRLPVKLKSELTKLAERERRSLNQQIVTMLESLVQAT